MKNYTTYYDRDKNMVYGVANTHNVRRHMALTVLYPVGCLLAGSGGYWVSEKALTALGGSGTWWGSFFPLLVCAVIWVVSFVEGSLRLSLFPGIFVGRMKLDEKSKEDRKLANLLEANQRVLDANWFEEWANASINHRDKMLTGMDDTIRAARAQRKSQLG